MYKCEECLENTKSLYKDPRHPPISVEDCLCLDCYGGVLEGELDEAESALDWYEFELERVATIRAATQEGSK